MSLSQAGTPGDDRVPVLADIMAPEKNSFGVIRLAMAIAVLFSHSYLFATGTTRADPLIAWTNHTFGEHAVQVFFFLSGILIAQSFDRTRSLTAFTAARVLRIFPALIVVVLLTALVLGPLFSTVGWREYFSSGLVPLYVVKTVTLVTGSAPLPGLFQDLPFPRVNMSLWTLKYEVICYAGLTLLGLLGLFNARWRTAATVLLAAGVAVVYVAAYKPMGERSSLELVRYFALYFGMGTLAYLCRDRLQMRPILLVPLALVFWASIGTRFAELACAVLLGYATIVAARMTWGFLTPFTRQHDWSYGVYIYAAPLQQALLQLWPDTDPLALSCFALAATLPLAKLSWDWIEKPAMALRHRFACSGSASTSTRPVGEPLLPTRRIKFGGRASVRLPVKVSSEAAAAPAPAAVEAPGQRYEARLARLVKSTRAIGRALLTPMMP